jgi:hypothetical protein
MKVDKDTLVKHRFWVGLGAFTLLWLIILMVALFSAGSKAAENALKVKKQKDDVVNQKDIKNERFTSLVTEKKEELQKQKNQVWKEAWKGQATMMFWPHPQRNPGVWERLEREGYFSEEIDPNDRSDYKQPGVYDSQLPVDGENGLRYALWPVQAKGGDWNLLIRRATFDPHNIPTNEEVWYAQEDLWVQRELLGIVKDALESARWFENVANFKRVEIPKAEQEQPAAPAAGGTPGAEEAKKPVAQRQRFRNPHWQLDLVTEQGEKDLTASTQTTLKYLDPERAGKPVAGLSLLVGQRMEPTPKAQLLAFEGKPDGKGLLSLKAAVPLPGFSSDFDGLPFVVTLAGDKDDPPPAAPTQRFRFRNPDWELELILEKAPDGQYVVSGKSKLKNVNVSKRTLALNLAKFTVLCGGREVTEITINEDWLPAGSTAEIKQASRPFVYDAGKQIDVRQDFTWATSPIKRVDAIEFPGGVSFNSHRTANLALKPAAQFPLPKAEEAAAPAGPAGGGPMGGMAGGPKGEMGRGAATDTSKTPNGLIRDRYISVTDQVRHMPVALDLIVDQAHMQDVLTAVVNSRLRIQITQVQWRRIRGVKSTGDEAGPGMAGGMAPPGVGGLSGPPSGFGSPGTPGAPGSFGGPPTGGGRYGSGGMSPGPMGGSSGGPLTGGSGGGGLRSPGGSSPGSSGGLPPIGGSSPGGRGPGTPSVGAGDDSDPNLVELAVYGIAALYERYPPKPKADAAAAAPGGAAPAVPNQPAK